MKRVVVTEIEMINALGLDKDSSFKAICEGKTGVKKITSFDVSDFPVQIAAEITDFDPLSVMDAKEVKKVDRFIKASRKTPDTALIFSETRCTAAAVLTTDRKRTTDRKSVV